MKTLLGYTTEERKKQKWAIAVPSNSNDGEFTIGYVSNSPEESKKDLLEKTGMSFKSVVFAGFKLVQVEVIMKVTGVLEQLAE